MSVIETRTKVPSFPDVGAVITAQTAKRNQTGGVDLYPRDGTQQLFQLEERLAGIFGLRKGSLLLYNTGMSAVVDALEISRPTVDITILRGQQHYSQAGNYISDELRSRGVQVFETDPGSVEQIDKSIKLRKPDIIFFETVTNGSIMSTLDLRGFLSLPSLHDLDPLIILDNTLPTTTGVPMDGVLKESGRRIIVVESGTKYVGLNSEMCGIIYAYDKELLFKLKKRRQRTGSLLSASAVETIRDVMPQTAEDYHLRNQAIFRHTLRLARACFEGAGENVLVVHPNLPNHPNEEYANAAFPEGASPVLFIQPTDFGEDHHYQIARQLWNNPVISGLCDLGQSFGFERARIWPDDNSPVVRISGGIYSEDEQVQLDEAFYEVFSDLK